MDTAFAWCAFVGAWLLVAGPVYQAAVELREEDIERDDIAALAQQVDRPESVSPWWWLVPPVHVWLSRRANRDFRRELLGKLTDEQSVAFVSYVNKATGWLFVGLGGFLLATSETWALHEEEEWPVAIYWLVVVVMAFLCVANTAVRMQRSSQMLGEQPRAKRPRRYSS